MVGRAVLRVLLRWLAAPPPPPLSSGGREELRSLPTPARDLVPTPSLPFDDGAAAVVVGLESSVGDSLVVVRPLRT